MLATRLNRIKPSPTLEITEKAAALKRQGHDVIGLGAGEPDFPTPAHIKEAGKAAIDNNNTKYTAVDGTPQLKQAIINKFKRENGLSYEVNQITVGSGGKQVLFNLIMASVNPGDEVIVPSPYWVSYIDIVALAEGIPVVVKAEEVNNFKITKDQLTKAINQKTKWFILNSPSNPTGSAYTDEELRGLADVLLAHPHVWILSDDIYEHILFENGMAKNITQIESRLKDRTFIVNGVSKAYSMTGWRLGYGAGSSDLVSAISMLQSQSTSNPCSISQFAAIEALNGNQEHIKSNNAIFVRRRDLIVGLLNDINGITCMRPDGAFYVFASMKQIIGKKTIDGKIIDNCSTFASLLLERKLVAVVPGIAFGAEGYFRISYATSDQILTSAANRIKEFVEELV